MKVNDTKTRINESKSEVRLTSYDCRCTLDGKKMISKPKLNNDKCQCECKMQFKQHVCEEEYARSFSICTCMKLMNIHIIARS